MRLAHWSRGATCLGLLSGAATLGKSFHLQSGVSHDAQLSAEIKCP